MKFDKNIRIRKNIRISLVILFYLSMFLIIGLVISFVFINKRKWTIAETIISILVLVTFLIILIDYLLNKSLLKKFNNIINKLLGKDIYNINAKLSYDIIKKSKYKSMHTILYSNELNIETNLYKMVCSNLTIVKNDKNITYANLYVFDTRYSFKDCYLLSHSLNIEGFDKYHKESLGNTNIYLTELMDISNMNVSFSSNFFISFENNRIIFIDFNDKEVVIDNFKEIEFINYINNKLSEIDGVYRNLISLYK